MSQLQVTGEAKIRDIQGPVVANSGVITALDGAASQYVRGDGTLADFPTSSGGGSSVSYYLNSSVSQGTIGGVAYRELSKDPIIGAGTDIAISSNGYVANYITDANDPDVVLVPGGNFNCEFYFSVNNNTGNPTTYAELYKYDGTTFTLLGTSAGVPESINQGTTIAPYYFAIPVATATLALTDRLAIRIYVNVSGRTITLHTENGHLCQVVTTLSKGMVSLNNLTDQSQYLATGTAGTDFNIASSGDTHTFNIPSASATNRGLITTGSQTIAGAKDFDNTAIFLSSGGTGLKYGASIYKGFTPFGFSSLGVSMYSDATTNNIIFRDDLSIAKLLFDNSTQTYTFPNASGTLALTDDLSDYVPYTGATANVDLGTRTLNASGISSTGQMAANGFLGALGGLVFAKGNTPASFTLGDVILYSESSSNNIVFRDNTSKAKLDFNNSTQTYTFPASSGTIALTSNLSSYVPYTGATANVDLGTFDLTADVITGATGSFASSGGSDTFAINHSSGNGIALNITKGGNNEGLYINKTSGSGNAATIIGTLNATTLVKSGGTSSQFLMADGSVNTSVLPSGAYLPLTGGTLTGPLIGTTANFSGKVGINATIASWLSTYSAMQLGLLTAIWNSDVNFSGYGNNLYYDGTQYRYLTSTLANKFELGLGYFTWAGSPTGTAGDVATISEYMRLNATGNLGINTLAAIGSRLQVNGNVAIGFTTSTAAPTNGLAVAGAATFSSSISATSATFSGALTVTNNVTIRPTAGYNAYFQQNATALRINYLNDALTTNISAEFRAEDFVWQNNLGQQRIKLFTSGNVIIGVDNTDAGYKLDVSGTGRFTGALSGTSATFSGNFTFTAGFNQSIGWGGNTSSAAANPLIYSNDSYLALNSKAGSPLYLNFDNTNAASTINMFNGKFILTQAGAATFSSYISVDGATSNPSVIMMNTGGNRYELYPDALAFRIYNRTTSTYPISILNNGNVGIGTSSPSYLLHLQLPSGVNGEIIRMSRSAGAYAWSLGIDSATSNFNFYNNGSASVANINLSTGAYTATSDERLKENIIDSHKALDKVLQIKVRKYDWKDSDIKEDFGFVAQELYDILPQYVSKGNEDRNWGVAKAELVPILVKAIQELEARIKQLENK